VCEINKVIWVREYVKTNGSDTVEREDYSYQRVEAVEESILKLGDVVVICRQHHQ